MNTYYLLIFSLTLSSSYSFSSFSISEFLSPVLRSEIATYTPLTGTIHKACDVKGKTGVCMFTWECVNAGGTPIGVCRQGLSFGSCCTTPSHVSPLTKMRITSEGKLQRVSYATQQCGMPSKLFTRRGHIYNGIDAQFGEFPWMASVRRVSILNETLHWCGGSLLNNEWIISAAHCFYRVKASNIIARLGELDFKNKNEVFPYVERRIKFRVTHPKYTKISISDYDICLLKMDRPIRFQPYISPICLPSTNNYIISGKAVVTGWGKTSNDQVISNVLQKVTVPIIDNKNCSAMMKKELQVLTKFSNKLFCAGYASGEKDSCQGDSGGPLQMKGDDGRYFVIGVVSTGIGCGKPNFPGIYLRVSPFTTWIMETISK